MRLHDDPPWQQPDLDDKSPCAICGGVSLFRMTWLTRRPQWFCEKHVPTEFFRRTHREMFRDAYRETVGCNRPAPEKKSRNTPSRPS